MTLSTPAVAAAAVSCGCVGVRSLYHPPDCGAGACVAALRRRRSLVCTIIRDWLAHCEENCCDRLGAFRLVWCGCEFGTCVWRAAGVSVSSAWGARSEHRTAAASLQALLLTTPC